MAPMNAASGGSSQEPIPGLSRTYGQGSKEPSFAELLAEAAISAVHLEVHDWHITTEPLYQAWLVGKPYPQPPVERYGAYRDLIRQATARGVRVRRGRIVSEPVSDYVRWQHSITSEVNIAAGEDVRWLPREWASVLAVPGNPYWVFDDRLVRFTLYGGDGQVHASQYSTDKTVARFCADAFEAVWERAIPHADYRL